MNFCVGCGHWLLIIDAGRCEVCHDEWADAARLRSQSMRPL